MRGSSNNISGSGAGFDSVKRSLEDKINKINSYQSKKGQYNPSQREYDRDPYSARDSNPQSPTYGSRSGESLDVNNSRNLSQERFSSKPLAEDRFTASMPHRDGYSQIGNVGNSEPMYSSPSNNSVAGSGSQPSNPYVQQPFASDGNSAEPRYSSPSNNRMLGNQYNPYSIEGGDHDNRFSRSNYDDMPSKSNFYDMHQKLERMEQDRYDDLRYRAGDDKISYLSKNLENIEQKVNNIPQGISSMITPLDVSLELIQRRLDQLEQDRIDELRSKIERERSLEIKKALDRLEEKIENHNVQSSYAYNTSNSSDLLELIQRKLDQLEKSKVDSIKSQIEEERALEISSALEKLEAKISASDKGALTQAAYLEAVSKEDLLRKLEKLEQDRVNDLRDVMEQERILLLNKQIEKLESKIDDASSIKPALSQLERDTTSDIVRKLERLEQDKLDSLKGKVEEERLMSFRKALENIESKIEKRENEASSSASSASSHLLNEIYRRLDGLERNKVEPSPLNNLGIDKNIERLESKLDQMAYNNSHNSQASLDSRYSSMLASIQKKLDRLENNKNGEMKDYVDRERLSGLNKNLEKVEKSISDHHNSYAAGAGMDGLGKKLDRLGQDILENLRTSSQNDKINYLSSGIEHIKGKIDNISNVPLGGIEKKSDHYDLFNLLNRRLDDIEKKRSEEFQLRVLHERDSHLTKLIEKLESKLENNSSNQVNKFGNSDPLRDIAIENINRKLESIEQNRKEDSHLTKLIEKLESKLENNSSNQISKLGNNDPLRDIAIENINRKLESIEQNRKDDHRVTEENRKFSDINLYLNKLESKISDISSKPNNNDRIYEDLSKKLEKIEQQKMELLSYKSESENMSTINRQLEKIEHKISSDKSSNNSNDKIYEELSKKIERIEQNRLNEKTLKEESDKFNMLSRQIEKLENRVNNSDHQPSQTHKSYENKFLEDISKKLEKIESARMQDLLERQEKDKSDQLNKTIEKLESKIANITARESAIPNLDLYKKLEKQQEKIEELSTKLEQERINSLNRNIEKLESKIEGKISNPPVTPQVFDNPILMDINNKLDSLKEDRVDSLKDSLSLNRNNEIKSYLSRIEGEVNRSRDSKEIKQQLENSVGLLLQIVSDSKPNISESLLVSLINALASKTNENKSNLSEDILRDILKSKISDSKTHEDRVMLSDILSRIDRLEYSFDKRTVQSFNDNNQELVKSLVKLLAENKTDNKSSDDSILKKLMEHKVYSYIFDKKDSLDNNPNTLTEQKIKEYSSNNKVLEDINANLKTLKDEVKILYEAEKSKAVVDDSLNKGLNLLLSMQEDNLKSIDNVEKALVAETKRDIQLMNYLLEKDTLKEELDSLHNELSTERDSIKQVDILSAISSLKEKISETTNVETESLITKSVLEDIRNQQDIIQKTLEESQKGDLDAILVNDVKNLLEEVNYRNKVLSQSLQTDKEKLMDVSSKVDSLFSSINKIEDLIGDIFSREGISDSYRESIEENFSKLKEDNTRIIEAIQKNKEDLIESDSIGKKRILDEFDSLYGQLVEFNQIVKNNNYSENSELNKALNKIVDNFDIISVLHEQSLSYYKYLENNIESKLDLLKEDSSLEDQKISLDIKDILLNSQENRTYFQEIKKQLDTSSLIINNVVDLTQDSHKDLTTITSVIRTSIDTLSKTITDFLQSSTVEEISDEVIFEGINKEALLSKPLEIDKEYEKTSHSLAISLDNIDFFATMGSLDHKISSLDSNIDSISLFIEKFNKELSDSISPKLDNQEILDNVNKFIKFNIDSSNSIKISIKDIKAKFPNSELEYRSYDRSFIVMILKSLEELIFTVRRFFEIYLSNTRKLISYLEKNGNKVDYSALSSIAVDVEKYIHSFNSVNSAKEISNIVVYNKFINSPKVDILANMEYLNKEITKKTNK